MKKNKIKCGIYTRVSTEMQADKEYNSAQAQEDKIKSFIKSQDGFVFYETYSDLGFSGANLERPALIRMLNDINLGKIDMVIAYKIDRLTRSLKNFYDLLDVFKNNDVRFISVTEMLDTSTPSGILLRNIMLSFAEFERQLIGQRTRDKLIQQAKMGFWTGGIAPYGFNI